MTDTPENPKVVLCSSDRIMTLEVQESSDSDLWSLSDPIPGVRIINAWEIYHGMWLVLGATEGGKYNIYRSIDEKTYDLVHSHDSEIFNLFYIDHGQALFCAEDGWQKTINVGGEWLPFSSEISVPMARSAIVMPEEVDLFGAIVYGQNHKIYYCTFPRIRETFAPFDEDPCEEWIEPEPEEIYDSIDPPGDWPDTGNPFLDSYEEFIESFDTNSVWSGKWYPAIDGCAVGILAGAGSVLLRSSGLGENWTPIQTLDGIIKNIVASDKGRSPSFLIEVEQPGAISKLYWTYDLGDSLVPDLNRISPSTAIQAVYPTGTSLRQSVFAVLGSRVAGDQKRLHILVNNDSH